VFIRTSDELSYCSAEILFRLEYSSAVHMFSWNLGLVKSGLALIHFRWNVVKLPESTPLVPRDSTWVQEISCKRISIIEHHLKHNIKERVESPREACKQKDRTNSPMNYQKKIICFKYTTARWKHKAITNMTWRCDNLINIRQ
jgi:hypothetical protein